MAAEAHLGGELLEELVVSLNAERTEDAQAGVVQQFERRPDVQAHMQRTERSKRRRQPTRDDELLVKLQQLFGHLTRTAPGARVAAHQRAAMQAEWQRLNAMMVEYLGVETDAAIGNGAPDGTTRVLVGR